MWVTQTGGVAKLAPGNPDGATKFAIADIASAQQITTGPDGNLWTASADNAIRIPTVNPDTTFTSFPVAGMGARGIARGGDGRLWISDFGGKRIVSITTGGVATFTPLSGGSQEIAGGPGAQMAYSAPDGNPETVGRINVQGTALSTDTPVADPFGVTLGTDGAYWFAEFAANDLARLTPAGTLTKLTGFGPGSGPRQITVGAGNTLWVGLEATKKVARVTGVVAPAGGGGPAGGVPGGGDKLAPKVSKLKLSARRLRLGRRVTLSFTVSEAASLRLRFDRARTGRRKGGRCVKPTPKLRRARSCTRFTAAGTLKLEGKQGVNRIRLTGRVGGRTLRPARYRLVLLVTDHAGNAGVTRTATLSVLARKRARRR